MPSFVLPLITEKQMTNKLPKRPQDETIIQQQKRTEKMNDAASKQTKHMQLMTVKHAFNTHSDKYHEYHEMVRDDNV